MGRFRAGAFLGTAVSGSVLALAIANCASPTQIIVDVRADRSICASISAGIAVTTLENIDTDRLEIYENGCDEGTDKIGTLTITPSGGNDDWVGIRVIGAVNDQDPDSCGLPGGPNGEPVWTDCILARRRVQFVPGKTVNITVRLTERCVDRYCGGDLECNLGVCVQPEQIQPDGGNSPPQKDGDLPIDPEIGDGAPGDAPLDVFDNDACARCNGTSCNAGECRVDCNVLDCVDKTYCADGLNCTIECLAADKCNGTRCATNGTCTFNCAGNGAGTHCEDIACAASVCHVNCQNAEGTCDGVYVDGGTNVVKCTPTAELKATCNKVECRGGACTRTCADAGCGPETFCTGTCTAWEDAAAQQ
ncbi:MAG: hypothetical protein KF764_14760 [Labilithrix sp.]|nr:hypothetical protein [Labilithrix sp.]MBX3224238.1 hypothetical protein [Labilithrix sp.]